MFKWLVQTPKSHICVGFCPNCCRNTSNVFKIAVQIIFGLRQLGEKTIEQNSELNLVFLDQEKAFDQVDRNKLWQILRVQHQGQVLDNNRAVCTHGLSTVCTQNRLIYRLDVSSKARQGCVYSLFILSCPWTKFGEKQIPTQRRRMRCCLQTTKAWLMKKDQLQKHADCPNPQDEELNMKISIRKTRQRSQRITMQPQN